MIEALPMADTSQVENGSDDGSDVLTDFGVKDVSQYNFKNYQQDRTRCRKNRQYKDSLGWSI